MRSNAPFGTTARVLAALAVVLSVLTTNVWAETKARPLPSLLTLKADEPSWTRQEAESGYVVYSDTYMQPFMLYQTPKRSQIVGSVSCRLAQDEYEPLMLGVYALKNAEALRNVKIDVRIDMPVTMRVMELRDYWRPWFKPAPEEMPGYSDLKVPDVGMSLRDSIESVSPGTTRAFWLTFHAPPGTRPGEHRGTVRVAPEGKPPAELDLTVTVLPFVLPRADIPFGMYSYVTSGVLRDQGYQRQVYLDMIAHGLNSVTVYDSESKWSVDPDTGKGSYSFGPRGELEMRLIKETGLRPAGIPIFYTDYKVVGWHPAHRRFLGDKETMGAAEAILKQGRLLGCDDMVFQVEDEPAVRQSDSYYQWAEAWKKSPCRMATAMSMSAASQLGHLHDVQIVHIGGITPELIAEARRAGNEVWTYQFSLAGSTPLANRYCTGLYTWGLRLSGNYGWVYYISGDEYVGLEADDIRPKPSYEGFREGIDDHRYLRLLETCIAADERNPIAKEARKWLESVRAKVDWQFYHEGREWGDRSYFIRPAPHMSSPDYENVRTRAVSYIDKIGIPAKAPVPARPKSRAAKFEASPFLDRSFQECVAGLKSEDMHIRRAAAAALALRGAEGASAVPALTRQLTDKNVRLQAFRAIGAIGIPAAKAAPALGGQLKDRDAFVRMGAAYALGGLGEAAVSPLRPALFDSHPVVVQAACDSLSRIGPAAAPAVPDLLSLLVGRSDDPSRHVGELTASSVESVMKAISGIGPGAAAAVPTLIERYQRETGGRKYGPAEAEALAAIGPAATAAVPVLEEAARIYDWKGIYGLYVKGSTLYALFSIRADESDLQALADLLPEKEYDCGRRTAELLARLGKRARPVRDKVVASLVAARAEKDQALISALEAVLKNLED